MSSATAAAPPSRASASGVIQIARRPRLAAAQAPLRGRADPDDGLAVELVGLAGSDRHETAGRQLARGDDRGPEALALDLLELRQRLDLAARASVDLAERAVERRLADDRDGEDVGLDVPGLVADNTQPHAEEPPPGWARRHLRRHRVGGRHYTRGPGRRGCGGSPALGNRRPPRRAGCAGGGEEADRRVEPSP